MVGFRQKYLSKENVNFTFHFYSFNLRVMCPNELEHDICSCSVTS